MCRVIFTIHTSRFAKIMGIALASGAELRIVIGVVVMLQPGHLMVYSIWNEEQAERENSRLASMERRKFQLSE